MQLVNVLPVTQLVPHVWMELLLIVKHVPQALCYQMGKNVSINVVLDNISHWIVVIVKIAQLTVPHAHLLLFVLHVLPICIFREQHVKQIVLRVTSIIKEFVLHAQSEVKLAPLQLVAHPVYQDTS